MIATNCAALLPEPVHERGRFLDVPRTYAVKLSRRWEGRTRLNLCSLHDDSKSTGCLEMEPSNSSKMALPVLSSPVASPEGGDIPVSLAQKVQEVVLKQVVLAERPQRSMPESLAARELEEAYDSCRKLCAEHANSFYLASLLMTPERRKAIWAIYVWGTRIDELVDGPNASHISDSALDLWELRLEDIFAGSPYDMLDAALSDTVANFPIDIQPFKDMIDGMRMDLTKSRYKNFDELYLYCYRVAGTVGLMTVPIIGIAPDSKAKTETAYRGALALSTANQLTNILRDVGEDARRGRIYLPQDELEMAGLSEAVIFEGHVTDKWRSFMKSQIARARAFYQRAEEGVNELNQKSRWPVWASLLLYRQILEEIESNDYDNFTKRASVPIAKKLIALSIAYWKSLMPPSSQRQ